MDINLTDKEYKIILEILEKNVPNTKVLAYGSRIKGLSKSYSDLDIAIFSDDISNLKEAFDESDLTFKVDVLSYYNLPEHFKKNIEEKYIVLQK